MWAQAVWKERGREEEGVIPKSWMKDKAVYWPPGTDASKAMQKIDKPDKYWRKFVLSKVKFTSSMFISIGIIYAYLILHLS